MAIAEALTKEFAYFSNSGLGYQRSRQEQLHMDRLYDWLYERDYEPWFCNPVRKLIGIRSLKDYFLRIHTGETLVAATPDWPWDKRAKLGQQQLEYLARDFLVFFEENKSNQYFEKRHQEHYEEILRRLEIDGYLFRDGALLQPETEILDVEAERGLLHELHSELGLGRGSEIFIFLDLSEKHYVNGDWSDSIGNARKFVEAILQEVALSHGKRKGFELGNQTLQRPVAVREYLEHENLLEKRERETLDKLYGLLSHTGGHPYMAEQDQARLLRQLSLTMTQFILLRLEGYHRSTDSSNKSVDSTR